MKKFIVLIIAGTVIMSCNNQNPKNQKTETKTEENTKPADNDNSGNAPEPPPDYKNTTSETNTGNSSKWSSADENRFMRDCESTASPKVGAARANEYCDCMLQKIKDLYSSYEQADRELGRNETEMNRLADDCNNQ